MPSLIQSDFTGGEWAPEYSGRTDLPRYRAALARLRNMIAMAQGGATKRPGFRHVAATKYGDAQPARLVDFGPASTLRYKLEIGPGYIRFFRNRAPVLALGVPYEVANPYAAGDLAMLSFTADTDRLWVWHIAHPPHVLVWNQADDDWTFAPAVFVDGPYLDPIGTISSATPDAAAASATVTVASIAEINLGQGFLASDVGRLVRFEQPILGLDFAGGGIVSGGSGYAAGDAIYIASVAGDYLRPAIVTVTQVDGAGAITAAVVTDPGQYLTAPSNPVTQGSTNGAGGSGFSANVSWPQTQPPWWVPGTITAVNGTGEIEVTLGPMIVDAKGGVLNGRFVSTMTLTRWRLGAWSPTTGYPSDGALFQQRLVAGGTLWHPHRVEGGAIAEGAKKHLDFAPSLATGQVIDSNAWSYTLDDDDADPIAWISAAGRAQQPQLAVGASSSEFIIQAASAQAAVTPTNLQAWRETNYGEAPVAPLRIGRFLIFPDRSQRRLYHWFYQWAAGGYLARELAARADHLWQGRIAEMHYARTPHPVMWVVLKDGALAAVTYLPEEDAPIEAAHSHALGGSWWGRPAFVESLATGPAEDGVDDEVWAIVRRSTGGVMTRTVEVMTRWFRGQTLSEAVFLDGAVTSAPTFPAVTCALIPSEGPYAPSGNPDLPERGDTVSFAFSAPLAVAGDLDPGTIIRYRNGSFRLTAITSSQAVFAQCLDPPNSTEPALADTWSYTKLASVFTGFDPLNGRVATVIGDGALYPPQLVQAGTLTLDPPASYVTAGLPYDAELETLDLDLPAADGTSQMKTGRLDHLYLRVHRTLGGAYGPDRDHLDRIEPRDTGDLFGWAPDLIDDDLRLAMPGGSSSRRRVVVRQSEPWPMTLLAIVAKGGSNEQAPR